MMFGSAFNQRSCSDLTADPALMLQTMLHTKGTSHWQMPSPHSLRHPFFSTVEEANLIDAQGQVVGMILDEKTAQRYAGFEGEFAYGGRLDWRGQSSLWWALGQNDASSGS